MILQEQSAQLTVLTVKAWLRNIHRYTSPYRPNKHCTVTLVTVAGMSSSQPGQCQDLKRLLIQKCLTNTPSSTLILSTKDIDAHGKTTSDSRVISQHNDLSQPHLNNETLSISNNASKCAPRLVWLMSHRAD